MGARSVLVVLVAAAAMFTWGHVMADEKPEIPTQLLTVAESSGFTKTSTSAEVDELVTRLCKRAPHMRRFVFGKTVEGKELIGVRVPSEETGDPRPIVLVIGNIHSGECAGKEALLMLLRELSLDPEHAWLDKVTLLVVPNYNADGNDKMGPNEKNRPGQIGPEQMGTRANAMGLDLNRDFMKLEAPEARALIGLMNEWDPAVFIDCHTTNGSKHRYPLTYDVPHGPASPETVRRVLRDEMMPVVTSALEAKGLSTFYYGNFNKERTRWTTYGHQPRYSTEYVGLRGRLAILSEAYSYISYEERIVASREFVRACIDWVASHPDRVQIAVEWTPSSLVPIGAKVQSFDEKVVIKADPDTEVEFWGDYVPTKTVTRPFAYLVPPELTDIVERLRRHGIRVERLTETITLRAQVYKITSATKSPGEFQGHRLVKARAERRPSEGRTIPKGTYVVDLAQPLSNLIVYLLEPESDDGLVTWGAFDDHMTIGEDFPVLRLARPVDLRTEPVK